MNISKLRYLNFAIIILFSFYLIPIYAFADNKTCKESSEVCKWLKKVVAIKTPTMIASGILISDTLIVTNKHVIEDSKHVLVKLPNKEIKKGTPIANDHLADIILISLEENRPINYDRNFSKMIQFENNKTINYFMVAFDIGRNSVRVFPRSSVISFPEKNFLQARIHSNSRNQPGTSGGALIDENGYLIGIIASGGGEYNEAVPAILLKEIIDKKSNDTENFLLRGKSMRLCADSLEIAQNIDKNPDKKLLRSLNTSCEKANNKLLFDMVGQTFGRWGVFIDSEYFLNKSITLDPKSPTSLHSLAVTLHLQRKYKEEIEILKRLLTYTPDDPQALRLAIQAAGFTKNKEFADFAINLMEKHNPAAVPLAESFLKSALN